MSEQELTKWKNKYKLYVLLHNLNKDIIHVKCKFCFNRPINSKLGCIEKCPKNTIGMTSSGKVKEFDVTEKETIWCIEWIKYV